jgi:hypothetical protein
MPNEPNEQIGGSREELFLFLPAGYRYQIGVANIWSLFDNPLLRSRLRFQLVQNFGYS